MFIKRKARELLTDVIRIGCYYYISSLQTDGTPTRTHFIITENGETYVIDYDTLETYVGLLDDFGREIFSGDNVEIQNKFETKTSYVSKVYLSHNGAFVDPHPAQISMGIGSFRPLSDFACYGIDESGCGDIKCVLVGDL